jgi:hypothetical protein
MILIAVIIPSHIIAHPGQCPSLQGQEAHQVVSAKMFHWWVHIQLEGF